MSGRFRMSPDEVRHTSQILFRWTSRDVPVRIAERIVQIRNPQPGIRAVVQIAERQELPGYRKSLFLFQLVILVNSYMRGRPLFVATPPNSPLAT